MAQVQVRFFLHNYSWELDSEEAYLALMPENQLSEIRQFKHFKGYFNALAGKLLLLLALRADGQSPQRLAEIEAGPHGKPFHPDLFHFNVTHTDGLVAIAWSHDLPVGIDSERERPKDPYLFTKQFNPAEMDGFRASEDPIRAFFKRWTQKEAIVKEIGDGLTLPLREITEAQPGQFQFREKSWNTTPIDVGSDNHFVHLAVEGEVPDVHVEAVRF